MADTKTVLPDAEERMKKALDVLQRDLATIRTGRANPALIDHVKVDYYGTPTPINQVATVSVADARQIMIQPWDRQTLGLIEKAIMKSDLGITPSNDGTVIRLNIPALTEDRRRDLVKQVKKKIEDSKVALRNVRRDVADHLKGMEKNKEISEDEQRRTSEQLQKVTDRFIADADKIGHAKEAELLEL